MAKLAMQSSTPTFFILFILIIRTLATTTTTTTTTSDDDHDHHVNTFSRNLSKKMLGLINKQENVTHLHFYFHDIISAQNPTAIKVAEAPTTNASSTFFGVVVMIDDPLTVGPELSSKQVGRAQGLYASASQSEVALLMVVNYVFTEGQYNGSAISLLGRNPVFSEVREMPIVGGSGLFRSARGYAQARTISYDAAKRNSVVEYNVYVFH